MSRQLYIDMMEYSTDQLAQAAWVTDASGLTLDLYEYASDGAAQAAYVSSDPGGEAIYAQNTANTGEDTLGDWADIEYRVMQSFTLDATKTITKVKVTFGASVGTPAGDVTCRIETDSSDENSGSLAHANGTKTITPTASAENTFDFTDFELAAGYYWIVLACDNQGTGNGWRIRLGNPGNYANGHSGERADGAWTDRSPRDMTFKVYAIAEALQCYSEDTIVNQGSYSLKAVAAQTGSLNDTLTKSGLSLDLSGKSELKIDFYALRTGTNIQIQIHDSGGQTSTKDIAISSANVWETTTWDISGIADVDKDNIDQIIIKIINADAANTFYVDNFRSEEALQCYSEDTIKVQGDYSLKVLATQTGSLNKTLTKTLTDYLDYSVQDVIKFDVRASRTGTNIQLQIHDTGGTTSTHNINIASANVWQTETWDISGITGTDRDTIDKIIIKVSEATAANIIYMDNLYSQVIVESAHVFIGG